MTADVVMGKELLKGTELVDGALSVLEEGTPAVGVFGMNDG
jgi:hypothetical protein